MMRRLLVLSCLMTWVLAVFAQVEKVTMHPEAILTQHWAMPTVLNPAATGDIDFIRVRGGARLDYLGSHESPKNFMIAADSPFRLAGKRIGAGLIFNSQTYGLYSNSLYAAQGSYKLQIKKSSLSIGVQIGYFYSKYNGSKFKIVNNGNGTTPGTEGDGESEVEGGGEGEEPETPDNGEDKNYITHDVKGGAFDLSLALRYQHPKFHVGVSVLHLTNAKINLTQNGEITTDLQYIEAKVPMTLYFDAGGNIAINNSLFTLQPSVLLGSDFSDFYGVAEMRATYNQKITFGFDYRWNRAVGVLAGVTIKDFYIGYNWEYDYKMHPRGSTGNHELVLGYQFKMDMGGSNKFSHRSIRIM